MLVFTISTRKSLSLAPKRWKKYRAKNTKTVKIIVGSSFYLMGLTFAGIKFRKSLHPLNFDSFFEDLIL